MIKKSVKAINFVVGKTTEGVLRSSLFFVKTFGKSIGYTERVVDAAFSGTKKIIGSNGKKGVGIFTGGLRKKFGLNTAGVRARISTLEDKMRDLYLNIGKIGSGGDSKNIYDSNEVKAITEQIKNYEKEIDGLRKYLTELEATETLNIPLKKISMKIKAGFEGKAKRSLEFSVNNCIRRTKFHLRSDAIIFEKALKDLLHDELDIKRLAVSEIGKIGNKNAAPVLKEALRLNEPALQAEIINSLILLEDSEVFSICKKYIKHELPGLRTACVRGLYQAGKSEAVPLLIEALRDENVEVRNSAAIFLGWLEAKSATPSLLQVASDDVDKRVRKNAIQALSNVRDESSIIPLIRLLSDDDKEVREKIMVAVERISGNPLKFNNSAGKVERLKEIEALKELWMKKKYGISNGGLPSNEIVTKNEDEKQKGNNKKAAAETKADAEG